MRANHFDTAVRANPTITSDADGARSAEVSNIGKTSAALGIDGFGEVDLPAQPEVEGQPGGCSPRILSVEEPALLPFCGRGNSGLLT